ncbi:hypothetical protein VIGAN_03187000 [Vigna angularis var. angularis]|uniref:Uncharacterized protein n=1 Tax=Vigna angularis var. angularis TaxID=157739 RepID=A0A0S3RMZ0_PHAAN|nr:hypothetical protein VIGAN_03187000 [Vigna angularis var. angularis]
MHCASSISSQLIFTIPKILNGFISSLYKHVMSTNAFDRLVSCSAKLLMSSSLTFDRVRNTCHTSKSLSHK